MAVSLKKFKIAKEELLKMAINKDRFTLAEIHSIAKRNDIIDQSHRKEFIGWLEACNIIKLESNDICRIVDVE